MTLSRILSQYDDVAKVLNAVVETRSKATYAMPSYNAAVRWRQRAYHFRKLLQEQAANGKTPYDSIVLRVYKDQADVEIEYEVPVEGTLMIGGKAVDLQDMTPPMQLPLDIPEDELAIAAGKLGLDLETDK